MKKILDKTWAAGAMHDDELIAAMATLNAISHKPTEEESELVSGDIGEMS